MDSRRAAPRPIDKQISYVADADLDATQQASTIYTATFPCTLVGLRWTIYAMTSSSANNVAAWAIVKVDDGETATALTFTPNASLYAPERDVFKFGNIA